MSTGARRRSTGCARGSSRSGRRCAWGSTRIRMRSPTSLPRDVDGIERFARGLVEAAAEHRRRGQGQRRLLRGLRLRRLGGARAARAPTSGRSRADPRCQARRHRLHRRALRRRPLRRTCGGRRDPLAVPRRGRDRAVPRVPGAARLRPGADQQPERRARSRTCGRSTARRCTSTSRAWAAERWTDGRVGLVVGATAPGELGGCASDCPGPGFLVPGVGAQGGDLARRVARCHGTLAPGLVSISRGIAGASRGGLARGGGGSRPGAGRGRWRRRVLHCRPRSPNRRHAHRTRNRRNMGPIGWPELIILLVVVLIIFGPGKLPDIGNAIGRGVREFRKASNDLEELDPRRDEEAKLASGTRAPAPSDAPSPSSRGRRRGHRGPPVADRPTPRRPSCGTPGSAAVSRRDRRRGDHEPRRAPRGAAPAADRRSSLSVLAGAVVGFLLSRAGPRPAARPAAGGVRTTLIFLGPADALAAQLKIAGFLGIALAMPIILFEIWRFVTPGLTRRERRFIWPVMVAALLLFAPRRADRLRRHPVRADLPARLRRGHREPSLTIDELHRLRDDHDAGLRAGARVPDRADRPGAGGDPEPPAPGRRSGAGRSWRSCCSRSCSPPVATRSRRSSCRG